MFINAMIFVHEAALAILPVLIVTHIAGALWHKIIRRDGVLESMTGKLPI
jgi:cytochrome b561